MNDLKRKERKRKEKKRGQFKDKLKSFFQRCGQDTPPFFKKLRIAGMVIAAAGATLLAAPIALPAAIVSLAGVLTVGGAVATAMSQAAIVDDNDEPCDDEEGGYPGSDGCDDTYD
ncbi:MAG: hypothetical protein QNK23_12200 [Crocinitomicaceae bacterium]|nr:hypothetical protein [Crocinitomicaceae bacterium]